MNKSNNGIYNYEIKFIKEISKVKTQCLINQERKEFIKWFEHYKEDLEKMYDHCVNGEIRLSFEDFVKLAYKCTRKEFSLKKLKYTRPLV